VLGQGAIFLVPNEHFSGSVTGEENAEPVIKCARFCTASECLL